MEGEEVRREETKGEAEEREDMMRGKVGRGGYSYL